MTSPAAPLAERLVEGVGPIVIKELRQGLRARVFAIFLGALLTACVVVAVVAFGRASGAGRALGPQFVALYLGGLAFFGFFVTPFLAFRSTLRELEDETWVLLSLTGLGARAVVRGKWLSAMCQFALYASVCAPFVVFSWFLNGVGLPQILVALALVGAWTAFSTGVGIALATQAHSRLGRVVAHVAALALLALGTFLGVVMTTVLSLEGGRAMRDTIVLQMLVSIFVLASASTVLVLEGAAAGLALPTEAASSGPRRALLAVVVGAWVSALIGFVLWTAKDEVALAGAVFNGMYLVAAGFFAVSERDGWHAHVEAKGWSRPGALRSFLLVMGLLLASPVVWLACAGMSAPVAEDAARLALASSAYPALYLSLAVVLGRLTPLARLGEPIATRLAFIGATVVGVVSAPIVSLVLYGRYSHRWATLFSPLEGMERFVSGRMRWEATVFLVVVTAIASGVALSVLMAKDQVRS